MKSVNRNATLTEQAVDSIRLEIVKGSLVPGQLYTGSEVALRLGVSRTPVREALMELARRGMVRIEDKKGFHVLNTSVETLIQVFQVRVMLEVPLSRLATMRKNPSSSIQFEASVEDFRAAAESGDPDSVLRADRDFHQTLLAGSGNEKALTMLQEQRDFVLSTGVGTVPTSRSAMECFEDHADIISAYREGNAQAVARAVFRHITNTARILIHQETKNRPEFAMADVEQAFAWLSEPSADVP